MLAKLFIKNLKLQCIIGANDSERRTKQEVLINIALWTDIHKAVLSDNVDDAVNYSLLLKKIISFVETSTFILIETLVDAIAEKVLEDISVRKVTVKVEKTQRYDNTESVGIEITKERT